MRYARGVSEQPPFAAAWLAQRRAGDAAVADLTAEELRNLTDEEALRIADALLSATPPARKPIDSSGLVEQQRLFARARRR